MQRQAGKSSIPTDRPIASARRIRRLSRQLRRRAPERWLELRRVRRGFTVEPGIDRDVGGGLWRSRDVRRAVVREFWHGDDRHDRAVGSDVGRSCCIDQPVGGGFRGSGRFLCRGRKSACQLGPARRSRGRRSRRAASKPDGQFQSGERRAQERDAVPMQVPTYQGVPE
jgi:hypothetical protein